MAITTSRTTIAAMMKIRKVMLKPEALAGGLLFLGGGGGADTAGAIGDRTAFLMAGLF